MSITGPSSYVPTMNAFDAHWAEANALLGAQPYVVRLAEADQSVSQAQFNGLAGLLTWRMSGAVIRIFRPDISKRIR